MMYILSLGFASLLAASGVGNAALLEPRYETTITLPGTTITATIDPFPTVILKPRYETTITLPSTTITATVDPFPTR